MYTIPNTRLFSRAPKIETLDDTDERVKYTGAWETAGNADTEYKGTTHFTRTPDAYLTFSFRGTQVQVLGSLGPTEMNHGPASFSYSLDGGERQGVVNTDVVSDQHHYNTQFVLMSGLANADHTLTMTHLKGGPWFVDRLDVEIPDPEPSTTSKELNPTTSPIVTSGSPNSSTSSTQDRPDSTSSATASSNTRTSSSSEVASLVQASISLPTALVTGSTSGGPLATAPTTTETVISNGQSATQPNVLAIALGVVGAALLLTLVGLLTFLLLKKKRSRRQHHSDVSPYSPSQPTTFSAQPGISMRKGMPALEDEEDTTQASEWTSGASLTAGGARPELDSETGSVNLSPPPYSRDT